MIRPVVKYSAVIYHSMLTSEQKGDLERLQARALKNIFSYVYSYKKLLELSKIPTLEERRIKACRKFAQKASLNARFASWFPKRRTGTRRGNEHEFADMNSRTDRRRNSPLFYFRCLLNDRIDYDVRK